MLGRELPRLLDRLLGSTVRIVLNFSLFLINLSDPGLFTRFTVGLEEALLAA